MFLAHWDYVPYQPCLFRPSDCELKPQMPTRAPPLLPIPSRSFSVRIAPETQRPEMRISPIQPPKIQGLVSHVGQIHRPNSILPILILMSAATLACPASAYKYGLPPPPPCAAVAIITIQQTTNQSSSPSNNHPHQLLLHLPQQSIHPNPKSKSSHENAVHHYNPALPPRRDGSRRPRRTRRHGAYWTPRPGARGGRKAHAASYGEAQRVPQPDDHHVDALFFEGRGDGRSRWSPRRTHRRAWLEEGARSDE